LSFRLDWHRLIISERIVRLRQVLFCVILWMTGDVYHCFMDLHRFSGRGPVNDKLLTGHRLKNFL